LGCRWITDLARSPLCAPSDRASSELSSLGEAFVVKGCDNGPTVGQHKHRLSNVDPETKRGDCAACGTAVPLKTVGHGGRTVGGRRWACRDAWPKKPTTHVGDKFGITRQALAALVTKQDGRCAICDGELDLSPGCYKTHLDHDHATGEVRGLLCRLCNTGIGHLRDDPAILLKAVAYLQR
jgi:hypothetical protein